MSDYQKYINALRKCAKEHEGDKTFTGQIIASNLCRETANLLEELEQEPETDVLDKIRAEIIEMRSKQNVGVLECLDIIDKYRAEREG